MADIEPRYSVADAYDYYSVASTLDGTLKPAFGVLDEKAGGYIAFCTDNDAAKLIVAVLNRCSSHDPNNHQGDTCPVHEA